jgi:N6-adenosine-specific RNA methylase IME4
MAIKKMKYATILADPPWKTDQLGNYGAINHYNLLTVEQIKAMPVGDLAEDDAHLYLWLTNSTIKDGYDVMEAWGFTPRSMLCWLKPQLGLGNYYRLCSEWLLFGTRGKAPVKFKAQPNWFFASRQDHSHKPEEQFAIIERMSHGPYLELFARRRRPGWDAWGNEIDSDVELSGYPVPKYSDKFYKKASKKGAGNE